MLETRLLVPIGRAWVNNRACLLTISLSGSGCSESGLDCMQAPTVPCSLECALKLLDILCTLACVEPSHGTSATISEVSLHDHCTDQLVMIVAATN